MPSGNMIINELSGAAINLLLFLLIPFGVWLFFVRKSTSFAKWIGIKSIGMANKAQFFLLIIISVGCFVAASIMIGWVLPNDVQLAFSRFDGMGTEAIVPIIIFSFIRTGLPEEIFFRGFLGKQLIEKLGFFPGNTIQATFFGLIPSCFIHGIVNTLSGLIDAFQW